jgi:hypothetical protein
MKKGVNTEKSFLNDIEFLEQEDMADLNSFELSVIHRNNELRAKINELEQQVTDIYNSNTWKVGNRLQKIYRFFIRSK